MSETIWDSAVAGKRVLVAETGVERLQLVGRVGASAFLLGGVDVHDGRTSGPNPYDLLSASLASCTAMTLRLYAERNGIPLGRIAVDVTYHRPQAGGRGLFDRGIAVGGDLDERQTALLLAMANRCPAGETLGRAADIRTTLRVGDEASSAPTHASDFYGLDVQAAAAIEETELRQAVSDLGAD